MHKKPDISDASSRRITAKATSWLFSGRPLQLAASLIPKALRSKGHVPSSTIAQSLSPAAKRVRCRLSFASTALQAAIHEPKALVSKVTETTDGYNFDFGVATRPKRTTHVGISQGSGRMPNLLGML